MFIYCCSYLELSLLGMLWQFRYFKYNFDCSSWKENEMTHEVNLSYGFCLYIYIILVTFPTAILFIYILVSVYSSLEAPMCTRTVVILFMGDHITSWADISPVCSDTHSSAVGFLCLTHWVRIHWVPLCANLCAHLAIKDNLFMLQLRYFL